MNKHIVNGKVAVIVSPGYGAGWSTWAGDHYAAFAMDARLVEAFLKDGAEGMIALAAELYPDTYLNGGRKAHIEWVPVGQQFRIQEYDGYEDLVMIDGDTSILTA